MTRGVLRAPAALLMMGATAFALWYYSLEESGWRASPQWSSALVNLTVLGPFLGPALSCWCAWQAWRRRTGGFDRWPAVRIRARVLADWFLPAVGVAIVAPVLALLVAAPALVGRPRALDLVWVLVAQLQLATAGAVGAALGGLFPRPLAFPGAILAPYLAGALPEGQADLV